MKQWRDVLGYEGIYSVSDTGEVRRDAGGERVKAGRILRWSFGNHGYPTVCLSLNGHVERFTVHRLVCLAFHGHPSETDMEVAHADGDRTNPSADNLRWATRKQNHADKLKHGTHCRGANASWAKLNAVEVAEIRTSKKTQYALAAKFGVSQGQVWRIIHGLRWIKETEAA